MNHPKPNRWRFGAVAGAVALIAGVATMPAFALSLGRISVLSALGEPLRAEIDVAQITAEEAASLKAAVGTPEAFKAAGLEYTPVLAGLEVTLQRRADGRSYLRLTSSSRVNEPFVDLVLQATWAAGRLTRDYTLLFDPPGSRPSATAVAPTAPILSRPATPAPARAPAPAVASNESSPATPPATRDARPAQPAAAARPEPKVRPAPPRVASAENSGATDKQLTVKPGDTAGKIAAQNRPGTVSLDQMLVAMLRSNPDAFIGGNINRLKSGAVLDMPGADTAGSIPASEASQTIIAQSKDFNTFRRKLAEGVAKTTVNPADRQAGGKVEAKVEDRAPATTAPDKLTLSKGSVQAQSAAAAEDAIAKNRQASEASARVAELSKNISDLNKLGVAPGPATAPVAAAPAASATKVPGLAVPAPSGVATPSAPAATSTAPPNPTVSASAPTTAATVASAAAPPVAAVAPAASPAASAAVATASTSAASQPVDTAAATSPVVATNKVTVAPAPAPETSFLDDLLENPLVLPLAAGLLALLAGLGIYSYRKRKGSATVDSSFLESRLQPDSFFGASGGQRIDTNEVSVSGSSLVYSPSQLDAAGDVDPVAEADVYLAYGRDLQAEEILK